MAGLREGCWVLFKAETMPDPMLAILLHADQECVHVSFPSLVGLMGIARRLTWDTVESMEPAPVTKDVKYSSVSELTRGRIELGDLVEGVLGETRVYGTAVASISGYLIIKQIDLSYAACEPQLAMKCPSNLVH